MRSTFVLIFTVLVMIVLVVMLLVTERRDTMFEVSRLVPPAMQPLCPDHDVNPLPCPEWGVRSRFPRRVLTPPIVHRVEPKYTDAAREHRVAGLVVFEVGIRRDGTVGGMCALKPLGCGLTQSAADAIRQWRFEPQKEDVVTMVTVRFPNPR